MCLLLENLRWHSAANSDGVMGRDQSSEVVGQGMRDEVVDGDLPGVSLRAQPVVQALGESDRRRDAPFVVHLRSCHELRLEDRRA